MPTILQNALSYLTIPTYEGSGQLLHVSIIDFLTEHNIQSWAGYRYWMVFTPFPVGQALPRDAYENPSLVASNDGQTWIVPSGITNPLHQPVGASNTHYDNDPELVYDPVENCLRIYFNETDTVANAHMVHMIKIYPDMTKSAVQTIQSTTFSQVTLSPTVVRLSATEWHMWVVASYRTGNFELLHSFSSDGTTWGAWEPCADPFSNWVPGVGGGVKPWHIEARYNKWEKRFEFLVNARDNADFNMLRLMYAQAPVTAPTELTTPLNGYVLGPTSGTQNWDNYRLYRSSFIVERQANQYFYRVWYAGAKGTSSTDEVWRVGYTEGVLGTDFTPSIEITTPTITREDSLVTFTSQVKNLKAGESPVFQYKNGAGAWVSLPIATMISGTLTDGIWKTSIDMAQLPPTITSRAYVLRDDEYFYSAESMTFEVGTITPSGNSIVMGGFAYGSKPYTASPLSGSDRIREVIETQYEVIHLYSIKERINTEYTVVNEYSLKVPVNTTYEVINEYSIKIPINTTYDILGTTTTVDSKTLTFTGTLQPGDELVIDMKEMTAKLNGTNVLHLINGAFFALLAGENTLKYEDESDSRTVTIEIQKRTKFL